MKYEHLEDLETLLSKKLITCRAHGNLPLSIYNYTASAQALPIAEWPEALKDCRGLILDLDGEVVGRPFRKFWNYEHVLSEIPDLPFTVWEKLDGSLGIVCNYRGSLVVATRGSFESEQAKFAEKWLAEQLPGWIPLEGLTYLAEILFPENRIVVDYGDTKQLRLLAVMEADGTESLSTFYASKWDKAIQFAPRDPKELVALNTPNQEGFVIRFENGFRCKLKFAEYVRLHRLITSVSTRTIWEMLRAGKPTDELLDRVPDNFKHWVTNQINLLVLAFAEIEKQLIEDYSTRPRPWTGDRKAFAEWAKTRKYPHLLFAAKDAKFLDPLIWKMVEPAWSTPFKAAREDE